MEPFHRLGDELAELGAGTSPVRGIAVASIAVIVGVTVIMAGFDGRNGESDIQATGPADSDVAEAVTDDAGDDPQAASPEADEFDIDEGSQILPSESDEIQQGASGQDESEETPTTTAVPEPRSVEEVSVMVVNSNAPRGSAARLSAELASEGYQTESASNADRVTPSAIYYVDGFELEAQDLASFLGVGDELVVELDEASPPVDDLQNANIVVVVSSGGSIVVE